MPTSVGTKAGKKQSSLSANSPKEPASSLSDREFENFLLKLENACLRVLDSHFAENRQDTEGLYWQQRLINIANPVSLALMEYKGPRHFHYHYRHSAADDTVLEPVLENPVDMLALVCADALKQLHSQLTGMQDKALNDARNLLENALQSFLQRYKNYQNK